MATVLGSLLLKLTGDTADARQAIDKVEKKAKGFSKFIKGAMGIGGAVIAFRALKNIATDLIQTYSVQETAEAKLRSAITATGKEGSISAQKLFDYASELQNVTTYGDEATISAMALLQQLGDLSEEGIKTLMPLLQDMASSGLMSLETAANLVGKTLGSTTNALSRYGITIDTTAPKEEKIAQLTEALKQKFGGLSRNLATTATAALEQYKNSVGDLKEAWGESLAKGIEPYVRGLTKIIAEMAAAKREALATKIAYEKLKELGEGEVLSEHEQTLILEDQIRVLGRVAASYEMLDEKANAALKVAEEKLAAYKAAIRDEVYWNALAAEYAAEEKSKAEAEAKAKAKRAKELKEWIEGVNDAYAKTEQGQKDILAAEIDRWEYELSRSKKYKPQIEAILELLYEERDAYKMIADEINDNLVPTTDSATLHMLGVGDAVLKYLDGIKINIDDTKGEYDELSDKIQEYTDAATMVLTGVGDVFSQFYTNRSIELENDYEKRKQAIEDNIKDEEERADALEDLDKEFDEKRKELKTKQARADKAQGILTATIETFVAANKALAQGGIFGGPVFAAIMVALGMAKVAAIVAQKIPKFATGADFIVPPGYPNDSYPILVESGERFQVTSKDQVERGGRAKGGESIPIYNVIQIDEDMLFRVITRGTRNRQLMIDSGSVT